MNEAATSNPPPTPPRKRSVAKRSRIGAFGKAVRAIAWPALTGLAFVLIDGVRELAEQLDCRLLQPASRPWPESLAFLTPLQDAVGAVAAASCQQGHGVRLILTALWAFSLAMFLLSLAGLVLRCWPRELKAWVDRFAAMIVDAFASGLGEPGRARAHAAATAATWLLALGAPAFALGQLPWRDAPPPPPVVTAKEAEQPSDTMAEQERILRDHRATVERLIAGATLTPPINVHVANPLSPTAPMEPFRDRRNGATP
ncbi:MAG: hypothetical protein LW860_06755 [Xanthomonadaceae bacterium]|nr:hypothetical protein [Xanthomonadaceae bacterium]